MRSETQQSGRRRRGGRRHRSTNGSSRPSNETPSREGNSSTPAAKAPQKKLGFFQRIIAFFTGKKPETTPGKVYGKVLDKPETTTTHAPRAAVVVAPQPPKPTRKPELLEVSSPKLYVGNLSFDAAESDLTELFMGVGSVQNSEVVSHRETQKSKGFAFVTMSSVEEAKRAVQELHDKEFMGRRLVVSGAKTADVRG